MGSLVTGIGYIGARLVEMLLDAGEGVVGLDNRFSTDSAALQQLAERPGFTLIEGDVRDEVTVKKAFRAGVPIDTVYHLAAQSSANPTAAPVRYSEETNLIGPRVVLEQACETGARCFVFGSSIQVYGRRVEGSVSETDPYGPILDIAHLSKVYVEKLMEMFSHTHGLRCVAARMALVYGIGPVMKLDPRFMTAPNKFSRQAALGEPLQVDASAFYPTSMIHVDDASRGLMALAQWPQEGYSAVNLLGETASVAQVAAAVRRLAASRGLDVQLEMPDPPPTAPAVSFSSALESAGFSPSVSLEKGLDEVLGYFMDRRAGSCAPPPRRGGRPSGGAQDPALHGHPHPSTPTQGEAQR